MSTALATRRPPKRRRFSPAHPDLYVRDGDKVRLAIHDGDLLTGSLTLTGFRHVRASGLVRDVAAGAANSKNISGESSMTTKRLGLIMNGVTGRMGLNQHLIRSIIAIRDQGGVLLANGDRMMPDPILIGRDAEQGRAPRQALQRRSAGPPISTRRWRTRTTPSSSTPRPRRRGPSLLTKAINAGKHVYCEKPIATNLDEAVAVLKLANAKGLKHGTVQDKLFLPGLKKLAFLRDSGFFGRMLSVRGEFGYWVFEGGWQEAQRPSWNYRSEDGGGIILDMVCHWRYVLDNLFGEVESVCCLGTTDIPERFDEKGKKYKATADDSAYATFRLKGGVIAHINMSWVTRVYRDDLVTFQVDGTHRLGGGGPHRLRDPGAAGDAAAGVESRTRSAPTISMPTGRSFPRTSSTTTASRSSGKCSFAMSARMRPTSTRCWKAPRACSLPNARCRAGASGAGSTSPRSRCEEAKDRS